jgi:hypothetical protein
VDEALFVDADGRPRGDRHERLVAQGQTSYTPTLDLGSSPV